jgi:hypothetical protein
MNAAAGAVFVVFLILVSGPLMVLLFNSIRKDFRYQDETKAKCSEPQLRTVARLTGSMSGYPGHRIVEFYPDGVIKLRVSPMGRNYQTYYLINSEGYETFVP